ncbi:MAG: hypothetical protein CSA85_00330 [Alphaproteobacteria bacterium]|nr:MAG: hypothetical protein CSA85_00330 [Alphaproteobacteria bacterium]
MSTFLLKLNCGPEKTLNANPTPNNGTDWENCSITIPVNESIYNDKKRKELLIKPKDKVWIWANEQYGGKGLTAYATAVDPKLKDDKLHFKLSNVTLLKKPFGFPKKPKKSNKEWEKILKEWPDTLKEAAKYRLEKVYLIKNDAVNHFEAFVFSKQSAHISDEIQQKYCSDIDRYLFEGKERFLNELAKRRPATIKIRENQRYFRHELFKLYNGKCVISGYSVPEALEAAHILPHNGDKIRDTPNNGLLLRSDLHKLFDEGLWSICPKTNKVVLSDKLKKSQYSEFDSKKIDHKADSRFMSLHFESFKQRHPTQ